MTPQKRKPNAKLEEQYRKVGSRCIYCRGEFPFEDITIDHFLAIELGGKHQKNRVFSCQKCNSLKGHKTIDEFRENSFVKINHILYLVAHKQDWKISPLQLEKIRRLISILKATKKIIENGYKPEYVL